MLSDGQLESVLKDALRVVASARAQKTFTEKDVCNHPVRFPGTESPEMVDGLRVVAGVDICLGQIEPRQIVVGKSIPQFQCFGDAVSVHF